MNILVIRETNPFFSSNASNNRFLSLAEGLVENGCNIDLLFLYGFYQNLEKSKFKKSGCFNKMKYKYLLPINFSNIFLRQFFYRVFPIIYSEHKIKQILKENKYDYIWLDNSPKVIQVGLGLFNYKLKYKYFHERSEFSWIGSSQFNKKHKIYLTDFLPHIDVFSVMTITLKTYYNVYVGEKTKMIHLPMTVDFSRFQETSDDSELNKPYVAYCGEMNNKKDGVQILIQAFIKKMSEFPNLHLYLAGPLMPRQDYLMQKSLISISNAENRITFLGELSKEEIPTFLLNASVLALARPDSKQAEGGFPTKLGEYLATGNPVCVTQVGEIGNYLIDNTSAFIAKPGSIDSFAGALERALTNKKASIVGALGKKVALEHFNKDTQAKVLYRFLNQNR